LVGTAFFDGGPPIEVMKRWAIVSRKTIVVAVLLAGAAVATAAVFGWWSSWHYSRESYQRLLAGDNNVELSSLVIEGQGRRIFLNDPAATRYLAKAFRSASQGWPHKFGTSYIVKVTFVSGGSVEIGLDVPAEEGGVTITSALGVDADPTYYWVELPEPMPAALSAALGRMRMPRE
jgi:hypothetical protein